MRLTPAAQKLTLQVYHTRRCTSAPQRSVPFLYAHLTACCPPMTVHATRQGWASVYWFCGSTEKPFEFCTCNFKWNAQGWTKAIILWSFVLTAALGVQRLAIQLGLNGLLPGRNVHAAICCNLVWMGYFAVPSEAGILRWLHTCPMEML